MPTESLIRFDRALLVKYIAYEDAVALQLRYLCAHFGSNS